MTRQPSGAVSFLFTDIEESTRLLRELGADRYAGALREHCRLLRAVFERHNGYEVNYEGDAFFVAFDSAGDAVAAAAGVQEGLAEHHWPDARDLRVRIGVHTGEALLAPPKYVGLDVHRAARIAASGHGGQVLVSAATAGSLAEGTFDLLDLGEHRFKDLPEPERIYQLGPNLFPPIRSLYRSSLPVPSTSFLGREQELAEVVSLLGRENPRLVTLTGPGGTGKTRLALQACAEAADRYPDGVYWVPLSALRNPELVLPTIAQAVQGTEGSAAELAGALGTRLAGKRALVLLDNAEQLLPAIAADLARLVLATPPVRFLVTSREPLRVSDEHVYAVTPLDERSGRQLFLERAAAVGERLEETDAVAALCANLDQLPLALELAAARTVLFSPEQLLGRLSERLDLLKGGRDADPRQQTLRATIEWSYELLDENEQRLLRSLSAFVGGTTYDAAKSVAGGGPDAMQSLLSKSLLRRRDGQLGRRYSMLETIRAFAFERLAACGEAGAVLRGHAAWHLELAQRAAGYLAGPEQAHWLRLLESEHDNFRAALTLAYDEGALDLALPLTAALQTFWYKHGHIEEGRRRLEHAVAVSGGQPCAMRARLVQAAGVFAGAQNDWRRAQTLGEEGLELYRALGDARGTAIMLRDLGAAAMRRGDHEEAKRLYEESAPLLRELGEHTLLATVLANLGDAAFRQGDLVVASERTREALDLQRELGAAFGMAISLSTLGFIALCDGRDEDARVALEESMLLAQELGSKDNLAYAFEGLAAVAAARGDWDRTALLLGRSEAIRVATATELEEAEHAVHERTLAGIRRARSEAEIAERRSAGRALSDDEAVDLALGLAAVAPA